MGCKGKMKLFNTLTGKADEIKASEKNKSSKSKNLKLFVCGPTVYDHSHIGHARTYIFFDTIAKYLRYNGFRVNFLVNITDIDDKMIARSSQSGIPVKEIAEAHLKSFLEDMKALGVKFTKYAKATDYMPEIIEQVKHLLDKGYAYETPNGIYFDVTKFKEYGKLSKQPLNELKVHRIEPDPTKRHGADFSLWKFQKPGEPAWPSHWGKGRPGWHIEDTAIAMHFFGEQYDLHGGGIDLIFPHHEAEIAQAEAITGKKPYVKHWIHVAFLIIDNRKMSKSLGNILTIKEALMEYPPELLRLIFLQTHYKKELNYTKEVVRAAEASHDKLKILLEKLSEIKEKHPRKYDAGLRISLRREKSKFLAALDDNFDSPKALTALFGLVKRINTLLEAGKLGSKNVDEILKFLREINAFLEILPKERRIKITDEVKELVEERERLRKEGKFRDADKIREKLKEKGFIIEDTPQGQRVRAL